MTVEFDHVEVREVSRHYGRRRALHKVTLTCRAGQVLGLLGPNGAGKSTLLAILSTLLAPSSGEVRYGGAASSQAGPGLRARIGMLGHDLYLYPELTARENLQFFARLYGMTPVSSRVAAALDRAGLSSRANDLVGGYSRGMRQRLALERALLHNPQLLLLDEPFTGLDDASARALLARLDELRAGGRIVVAATHDLDVAEGLLDRAAIMKDGRLVAVDEGRGALRQRYRSHLSVAG